MGNIKQKNQACVSQPPKDFGSEKLFFTCTKFGTAKIEFLIIYKVKTF